VSDIDMIWILSTLVKETNTKYYENPFPIYIYTDEAITLHVISDICEHHFYAHRKNI
jgi:hypothetical protein